MALPVDADELRRFVEFGITRWQLEYPVMAFCVESVFRGCPMTRDDYLRIVRAYCDQRTENREPHGVPVFWRDE